MFSLFRYIFITEMYANFVTSSKSFQNWVFSKRKQFEDDQVLEEQRDVPLTPNEKVHKTENVKNASLN